MSVVRENLDILNPQGNTSIDGRNTEVNFFGFRTLDNDINETNVGVDDTIYTAATSSTFPNPITNPNNHPVFGGTYTGTGQITYKVEISDAVSNPNQFVWYKNDVIQNSGTSINIASGTAQSLSDGVTTPFHATQGDTGYFRNPTVQPNEGDFWQMTTILSISSPHQLGRIHATHDSSTDDTKGKITFKTNNGGIPGNVTYSNSSAVITNSNTSTNLNVALTPNGTFYSPYIIDQEDFYIKIDNVNGATDADGDSFTWSTDSGFATIHQQNVVIDTTSNNDIGDTANTNGHLLSYSNGTSTNVVIEFASNVGHVQNDTYNFSVFSVDSMEIVSNGAVIFGSKVLNIEGANLNVRIYNVTNNLVNTL